VLVSYGNYWYPWFVRRLAERPANLWFMLKKSLRSVNPAACGPPCANLHDQPIAASAMESAASSAATPASTSDSSMMSGGAMTKWLTQA